MSDIRRVFVTGGSGFIGEPTIRILRDRGLEVINYDAKQPDAPDGGYRTVIGDVTDRDHLIAAVREAAPDAIIHLAAHADITASAWEDFASIHAGTANLLTAVDTTPSVQRVVNVSTQLVIGPGYQPKSLLDYRPYTPYGEAKAYAEALLLQWQSPVSWVTVRPTNIWGPRHPTFAVAIWKYLANGRYLHPAGAPVLRTYGYVDNTAHQLVAAMLAPAQAVDRQVLYAGDDVLDSGIWVDAFSQALRDMPARRLSPIILKGLGYAGDAVGMTGVRAPINSGRVLRMTVNYPMPLQSMLALAGPGPVSFAQGVERSVAWLRQVGVTGTARA